jgi:hypothetical protein
MPMDAGPAAPPLIPTAAPMSSGGGNSFLDQIKMHRRDALNSAPDPEQAARERVPTVSSGSGGDLSIGAIMQRRMDMGIGVGEEDDDDDDEEDWDDSDEDN